MCSAVRNQGHFAPACATSSVVIAAMLELLASVLRLAFSVVTHPERAYSTVRIPQLAISPKSTWVGSWCRMRT